MDDQAADQVALLRSAAMRLLAIREHSAAELRKKLISRADDPQQLDTVLADLIEADLVSDERFTEQFVTMRMRKGQGPLRIRADLYQRGVSQSLIDRYLDMSASDWQERIREVAEQRFGEVPAEDRKEQAKRARFLQARGFPEGMIRRYLWS